MTHASALTRMSHQPPAADADPAAAARLATRLDEVRIGAGRQRQGHGLDDRREPGPDHRDRRRIGRRDSGPGHRDRRRSGRTGPGPGHRNRRRARGLVASALMLLSGVAAAAELLVGTMPGGNGSETAFRLEAEDRDSVTGGRVLLGEIEYEISRVSRLGLIGARRFVTGSGGQEHYAEFLVFSSSFSEQTAVGEPWIAAREAYGCEEPYNTYLALYRVEGEAAVKALGPIPYPALAEDPSLSQRSRVSCFMARPPG